MFDDELVARHEAGHAVAAIMLGITLEGVHGVPTGPAQLPQTIVRAPAWWYGDPRTSLSEDETLSLWKGGIYTWAGVAAREQVSGSADPGLLSDDIDITKIARHLADGDSLQQCVDQLKEAARDFVRDRWISKAIEAVGAELLREGELSGADAISLVDQTQG